MADRPYDYEAIDPYVTEADRTARRVDRLEHIMAMHAKVLPMDDHMVMALLIVAAKMVRLLAVPELVAALLFIDCLQIVVEEEKAALDDRIRVIRQQGRAH